MDRITLKSLYSIIKTHRLLNIILIAFFVWAIVWKAPAQIPLIPISGADGEFTITTIGNQAVYRSTSINGYHAPYMYFTTETVVKNKTVYVEVTYLDYGNGRIGIDYNALSSAYTNATENFYSYLTDSRLIKTALFKLNQADFKNAQNLGAHLRIWSEPSLQKHIISAILYLNPSPLWKEYDENWNTFYTGRKYLGPEIVNATSFIGKVICGYQGWFRAPGDLSNQGWVHYFRNNTPSNVTIDLWPDMSEYSDDEKYIVPGWQYKDNSKVFVFSSANKKTVLRHFQWMQAYGIHGAAVQRFVGGIDPNQPNKEYNRTLAYAREAANRTGRVFFLEYDQSGIVGQDLINRVKNDWKYMVDSLKITSDNRYLHHNGKPVVGFYGLYPERFSSDLAHQVLDIFTQKGYEAFVMGSGEIFWHDASPPGWTPSWLSVYQRLGAYSPWNVGHYDRAEKLTANAATTTWKSDKALLEKSGVIFTPLIFPGFAWDNLMKQAAGTTYVPRRKGELMWNQIQVAKQLGAQSAFVAMFDEIDEGTAIFKVSNEVPVNNYFATLEGVPSDFYLSMTGLATSVLTGNQTLPMTMPNFASFTQPSIPEIIKPAYLDSTGVNIYITWTNAVHTSGIKNYQLELDGKLTDNIKETNSVVNVSNGMHTVRVRAVNQLNNKGGWSESVTFLASDKITAIKETGRTYQNGSLLAFPNPAINTLNIKINHSNSTPIVLIDILSLNGQLVRRLIITKNNPDDVFEWDLKNTAGDKVSPGIYLVRTNYHQQQMNTKVVVTN